jgi:hypothetical protein
MVQSATTQVPDRPGTLQVTGASGRVSGHGAADARLLTAALRGRAEAVRARSAAGLAEGLAAGPQGAQA